MAFGFQNCCDTEEYFYLNGIPATVSETEVYKIVTLEGLDFCATYVELPELFYQPLTYNLDTMVEQTSCTTCLEVLPCPDTIDIVLDENVTISNYNECSVLTEIPLEVTCNVIQPAPGDVTGYLGIIITGGQPPYRVYSANTETQIAGSSQISQIVINNQAPPGEYCYDVVDDYNAVVSLCCTINYSPAPLEVSCSSTKTSVWVDNGTVTLDINGGEPPYTTYYNGNAINLPLQDLSAGTYTLTTTDLGGQSITSTCTVTENIPTTTYPQYLCMDFVFCQAHFYLTFVSAGTQNYLPYYNLTNPGEIGVSSMTLSADTSFNWFTSVANSDTPFNVPPTCNLSPASNGNISFTKNIQGESPLGEWTSSGIFGPVVATVSNGQCIDNPPTFTAFGTNICLLDGGPNTGTATILPQGGSGQPYIIYVDGAPYNTTSIDGLSQGPHSIQVADSQSNLSSIGSVSIGTTNPTNLLFTSCGTLTTNLNSLAEYLNADFTAASSPINLPVGVQITGKLQLTVTYNLNTPNYDPDSNQYISDALLIPGKGALTTSPFVPSGTYVSNGGVNTLINFNSSPVDTPWVLTATYPGVTEFINRQTYAKTQVWTSTNTVTLSNLSYLVAAINTSINYELDTSPDDPSSNSTFYVQEISQTAQVNFKLSWINLDVSTSGCYTVDANPTIFEYLAQRTIPAFSYTGPFTGSFLNGTGCASQPSCTETFNMSSPSTNTNYVSQVYDDSSNPPIKTWYVQLNRINKTCLNGAASFPRITVTRASGLNWVPGTIYYLRFKFSVLPTQNIGVTFGPAMNYCLPTSGNGTTGYSFIITSSQLTQGQWYYPLGVGVNLSTSSQLLNIQVTNLASEGLNTPTFEMQISQCPWT